MDADTLETVEFQFKRGIVRYYLSQLNAPDYIAKIVVKDEFFISTLALKSITTTQPPTVANARKLFTELFKTLPAPPKE